MLRFQPSSNQFTPLKAFTHLCTHANFSVIGNALTIYCDDAYRVSVEKLRSLLKGDSDLSSYVIIHREYPEHEPYHLDSFDRDQIHYHFHFNYTLDDVLLTKILGYLIDSGLMTDTELAKFLLDFQQANRIPGPEFELLITQTCLNELKAVVLKKYSSKYASPQSAELNNKANMVVDDFERLIQTNTHVLQLRQYMQATFVALNKPTKDNINTLNILADQAKQQWPILSVSLLILGAALLSLSFSLGMGVAGAVVGMLGFGLFMSGAVDLYQRRQAQDFKDQDLSQNLSALSARLAT